MRKERKKAPESGLMDQIDSFCQVFKRIILETYPGAKSISDPRSDVSNTLFQIESVRNHKTLGAAARHFGWVVGKMEHFGYELFDLPTLLSYFCKEQEAKNRYLCSVKYLDDALWDRDRDCNNRDVQILVWAINAIEKTQTQYQADFLIGVAFAKAHTLGLIDPYDPHLVRVHALILEDTNTKAP